MPPGKRHLSPHVEIDDDDQKCASAAMEYAMTADLRDRNDGFVISLLIVDLCYGFERVSAGDTRGVPLFIVLMHRPHGQGTDGFSDKTDYVLLYSPQAGKIHAWP